MADETLTKLFVRPIPDDPRYHERLVEEFELVTQKNFTKVFLQVKEILALAKNDKSGREIPHIIRGSAGCSLICYLMNITNIDPIKENISLARFMHVNRSDMPDIDIDFPWNQRDLILQKIHTQWKGRVARISNHIHFQNKSALKQAIREEGYDKFLPKDFRLEDIFPDEVDQFRIMERANELNGDFRTYSLHCGGIVIFDDTVPEKYYLKNYQIVKDTTLERLQLKDKDRATQVAQGTMFGSQIHLDKDQVETENLIKIDILSNRGLAQLWEISHQPIEEYPDGDPKTSELLSQGQNIGIIYAESRALYKVFRHMRPKSIRDVAEALALIRPAASRDGQKAAFLQDYSYLLDDTNTTNSTNNATNNATNNVTNNKNKREDFIIYDDDAIQFIAKLLRISESQADLYRKGFSKNRWKVKEEFRERLKTTRKDLNQEKRDFIFGQLERLEEYSFCKSHAYSYAKLVWALAYQRAHNPKQFWAAALNHCNSSYRTWVHFREAKRAGIHLNLTKMKRRGHEIWKLTEKDQLVCRDMIGFRFGKIDNVKDYFQFGYWMGDDFLPGMYYRTEEMTRHDYYQSLGKPAPKKGAEETIRVGYFRGLIAIGRPYRTNKVTEAGKIERRQGRKITFLTIGYADGEYLDLILWGSYPLSKIHCIEGHGIVKSDAAGCEWIEVIKFIFSRI